MRKYSRLRAVLLLAVLTIMILPTSFNCAARPAGDQEPDTEETADFDVEKIIGIVMPLPEGGLEAIMANVVYPEAARRAGLEGRVVLNFSVDMNGEVQTIVIKETTFDDDMGCPQAAIDAVRSVEWNMPWIADIVDQARGGFAFEIPIEFKIADIVYQARGGSAFEIPIEFKIADIVYQARRGFTFETPIEFKLDDANANDQSVAPSQTGPLTGKIYGKVTDEQSGEPLPGASIVLEGTDKGVKVSVKSNQNGKYVIENVPQGIYTIEVFLADLESVESMASTEVLVEMMKSTELNFTLRAEGVNNSSGAEPLSTPEDDLPDAMLGMMKMKLFEWGSALQENVVYPESAQEDGIEGTVWVRVTLTAEGTVANASAVPARSNTTDPRLVEAAIDAAKCTTFSQYEDPGITVTGTFEVPVEFKLEQ